MPVHNDNADKMSGVTRGRTTKRKPNENHRKSNENSTSLPPFFTAAQLRKIAVDYDQYRRHEERLQYQRRHRQQHQLTVQNPLTEPNRQQEHQETRKAPPAPSPLPPQLPQQQTPTQRQHQTQDQQQAEPANVPSATNGDDIDGSNDNAAVRDDVDVDDEDEDDDDFLFASNAYLRNLHYTITVDQIVAHFAGHGRRDPGIVRVQIGRTKQRCCGGGLVTRIALVEFETMGARNRALHRSNSILRGRRLIVQMERPLGWGPLDRRDARLALSL